MDFFNEQIYDGRDAVEIPVVDKKAATSTFSAVMVAVVIAMFLSAKFGGFSKPVILPIIFMVLILCILFLGKSVIFLLLKKNKVVFEFNPENFIFNGEAIKWADMQKITYREFTGKGRGRAGASYYIRIYCGIAKEEFAKTEVKEKYFIEITGNTVLKISSKEAAKLIAEKFYRYYGFSQGVMLKKSFFSGNYELKPVSQKDVLQKDTDSSIETTKMFR